MMRTSFKRDVLRVFSEGVNQASVIALSSSLCVMASSGSFSTSLPSLCYLWSKSWRGWMWDGRCVCACVCVCASVWSPSVAVQEGSCVITHSTALTSSINSSQILITCFQDVALPLWPISSHSAGLQTADWKQKVAQTCDESTRAFKYLFPAGSRCCYFSPRGGERKLNVTQGSVHNHVSRC